MQYPGAMRQRFLQKENSYSWEMGSVKDICKIFFLE